MELRTGKIVDELVHEKILWPMRLANTTYVPEQLARYADRACGHAGDQPKFIRRGEPVPDWRFTDVLTSSAALYSSANDLLTYTAARLRGSGDAMRDTLAARFNRPKDAAALAWIVDDISGRKITYQVELVPGYTSYIGMDVANKTAVVVLQNSFNWTNGIGHRLLLRMADGVEGGGLQFGVLQGLWGYS